MSYETIESSIEAGRPIELYRFTMGAIVWRYASADEDLLIDGATYRATQISNDGVKHSGQAVSDQMNITAMSDIGPAAVFQNNPPITPIKVEILRIHEGLTVPLLHYIGEVNQVNVSRPGVARVQCQTMSVTMRRQGVRLGWQRSCPHTLYDSQCRVSKASRAGSVTIQGIDGFNVTANDFALLTGSHTYAGGFIEWIDPLKGYQCVTIESHTGSTVRMFDDTSDMYVGLVVTAYPGCDSTEASCRRFSNILNYGGFKNMPGKSPFDGLDSPVF